MMVVGPPSLKKGRVYTGTHTEVIEQQGANGMRELGILFY